MPASLLIGAPHYIKFGFVAGKNRRPAVRPLYAVVFELARRACKKDNIAD
jgi:hypothetical protein